jgi:hypothetical protein
MASYTLEHKKIAFAIYQKHGEINATLKELKKHPEFKSFNKTTLLAWASTKDERGLTWKDRLKEINVIKNEITDRDFANEKDQMVKEMRNMMDLLYKKSLEVEVKSAEGAARTYSILAEQMSKMTGLDIQKEQFVLMYKAILECFALHPVVGPVIKQYWHEIELNLNLDYEKLFRKKT